jgi:hypothetical protein
MVLTPLKPNYFKKQCSLSSFLLRDHSSIKSAKRWVGGVKKWQFLLIYSTIYADVGGVGGPKKAKNLLT